VLLTNERLYDEGKGNPNYPAEIELHAGSNDSTYIFIKDLKEAGISPLRHCGQDSQHMKMAIYKMDWLPIA